MNATTEQNIARARRAYGRQHLQPWETSPTHRNGYLHAQDAHSEAFRVLRLRTAAAARLGKKDLLNALRDAHRALSSGNVDNPIAAEVLQLSRRRVLLHNARVGMDWPW